LKPLPMFTADVDSDGIQDALESILSVYFSELLQFKKRLDSVGFDFFKGHSTAP
jgi:hypothetical protein